MRKMDNRTLPAFSSTTGRASFDAMDGEYERLQNELNDQRQRQLEESRRAGDPFWPDGQIPREMLNLRCNHGPEMEYPFYLGQYVWQAPKIQSTVPGMDARTGGLRSIRHSYCDPIEIFIASVAVQGFAALDSSTSNRLTTSDDHKVIADLLPEQNYHGSPYPSDTPTKNRRDDLPVEIRGVVRTTTHSPVGFDVAFMVQFSKLLCLPHEFFNFNATCTYVGKSEQEGRVSDEDEDEVKVGHIGWTCYYPDEEAVRAKYRKDFEPDDANYFFCGYKHKPSGYLPLMFPEESSPRPSQYKQVAFAAGFFGCGRAVEQVVPPLAEMWQKTVNLANSQSESEVQDRLKEAALRGAAAGNQIDLASRMIVCGKVSCTAVDDVNRPPFAFAIRAGNAEMAFMLLKYGATPNYVSQKGRSALHLAAKNGHAKLIKVLISKKLDVNTPDNYSTRPLHEAVMNQHVECTKLLINAGADISVRDSRGAEIIHVAAYKGDVDLAKIILTAAGNTVTGSSSAIGGLGDKEVKDRERTEENDMKEKTANTACANHGMTPLHYAVMAGKQKSKPLSLEIINLLLESGANPLHKSSQGKTVLDMVQEFTKESTSLTSGLPVGAVAQSAHQVNLTLKSWVRRRPKLKKGGNKSQKASGEGTLSDIEDDEDII